VKSIKLNLILIIVMDMLDNEESIIKRNTGIVYEFIRLKESKNKMGILGALEGIRYILSKYKNHEVILDIVSKCSARTYGT